jgi:hypothetical protein
MLEFHRVRFLGIGIPAKIQVLEGQNGFIARINTLFREHDRSSSNTSSRVLPKVTHSVQYNPHFRRGRL